MDEQLIISDAKVMAGKPIIRGTRVTVEHILEEVANGLNIEQMLYEYSHLTREGVQAAIEFAIEVVRTSSAYPINQASA
jgi:uncharacterized protein (DUF433 family)